MAARGADEEVQQGGVDGEGAVAEGGREVGDVGGGGGGGFGDGGGGEGGEGAVEGAEVGVDCCLGGRG